MVRRGFLGLCSAALAAARQRRVEGALMARPQRSEKPAAEAGLRALGYAKGRDGLLYVPAAYDPAKPLPLVLALHGATRDARRAMDVFQNLADSAGFIVLAPDSRGTTWDILRGSYGVDIEFIDKALKDVFEKYAVDPKHIAAAGFSDGASYALSIGIMNGSLFTHVIAFSPGFASPKRQEGNPRIFISHGRNDKILPIDQCSRRMVPSLRLSGFEVTYREFKGLHTVPREVAQEAVEWFVRRT